MRAAVLREQPGQLSIEDISHDKPGPHEVVVRTAAAGLCHSDLHYMEALYPHPLPAVLGHESAGVIEAVGDQVSYVKPGDHVITCPSVYCGGCEYCLTGRLALCNNKGAVTRPKGAPPRLSKGDEKMAQFALLSSFAERLLVHENAVVKIREDMPLDRAALIGCGVTTGVGAVLNTAKVEPGSTVAVIGCGGIGLSAVQGALLAGAARIIAIDMVPSKLEVARSFGATDVVNPADGDPIGQVRELTGGGVHYAFEAIGLKVAAEQAWKMLRPGGTAVVIGMIPVGQKVEIHGPELLSEKRLMGSSMGSNRFRVDMPRYIEFYLQGRLKLDEMVSARITLDEINEGFEAMKGGGVNRSVIVFE
ncbi:MAG: Zn-dependent alcohol dehydrogenase [Acidimicrobiales bacterium]